VKWEKFAHQLELQNSKRSTKGKTQEHSG